MFLFNYTIKIQ